MSPAFASASNGPSISALVPGSPHHGARLVVGQTHGWQPELRILSGHPGGFAGCHARGQLEGEPSGGSPAAAAWPVVGNPSAADEKEGAAALLELLPSVRAVVLLGGVAANVWVRACARDHALQARKQSRGGTGAYGGR